MEIWASAASVSSACNSISPGDTLHMLQTCRVGLRDPNPHMAKAPRLARRMGPSSRAIERDFLTISIRRKLLH